MAKDIQKRRKLLENIALVGMLILAIALALPIFNLQTAAFAEPCKWIFATGAVIYLIARILNPVDDKESLRIRRIRRMQAWGGMAFIVSAAFWFYNEIRLSETAGFLAIIHDTILFALVGAFIQIISSWMIYLRQKKEQSK